MDTAGSAAGHRSAIPDTPLRPRGSLLPVNCSNQHRSILVGHDMCARLRQAIGVLERLEHEQRVQRDDCSVRVIHRFSLSAAVWRLITPAEWPGREMLATRNEEHGPSADAMSL